MPANIADLAADLQDLFGPEADRLGVETGWVRRRRKLTAAVTARALVFGWMDDPDAPLSALAPDTPAGAEALRQRLTAPAADCLGRLLGAALARATAAAPAAIPLLGRFTAVVAEDSTAVALPAGAAADWPACGGSRRGRPVARAGMKLLVRYELRTGRLDLIDRRPARDSDRTAAAGAPGLPSGSLRLADLGFFDTARLAADAGRGVHWISRLPTRTAVAPEGARREPLADFLARQAGDRLDLAARVGTKHPLACRLLAWRCPPEVAATRERRLRRAMRRKGRKVSVAQLELCRWAVCITDLEGPSWPAEAIRILYRARWQVEWLFRRWKSGGGLRATRGRRGPRAVCEVLARLLGLVVRHWATLLRGGPLCGVSPVRAGRAVRRHARALGAAVAEMGRLVGVLCELARELDRLPRQARRRGRPSTRQLLFKPRLIA